MFILGAIPEVRRCGRSEERVTSVFPARISRPAWWWGGIFVREGATVAPGRLRTKPTKIPEGENVSKTFSQCLQNMFSCQYYRYILSFLNTAWYYIACVCYTLITYLSIISDVSLFKTILR